MKDSTNNDEKLGDYISQAEAARIIGISNQSVANLVRRGYFTTKAALGRILILRGEAEAFVPRPKGRPTKEASAKKVPVRKPLEILNRGTSKKYISQAEAARIRGVSQQAIANLIRRNRLTTKIVAGRTVVLLSDVETFTPKTTRRPPKKKQASEKETSVKKKNSP
jgi:predicted DNA-binding protein (UPF0251 family)